MQRSDLRSRVSELVGQSGAARELGHRGQAMALALKALPVNWPRSGHAPDFDVAEVALSLAAQAGIRPRREQSTLQEVKAVAYSHDGRRIIVSSWLPGEGRSVVRILGRRHWRAHTGSGASLDIFPAPSRPQRRSSQGRNRVQAISSDGGSLNIWNVATGERIEQFENHAGGNAFSPDGRYFFNPYRLPL